MQPGSEELQGIFVKMDGGYSIARPKHLRSDYAEVARKCNRSSKAVQWRSVREHVLCPMVERCSYRENGSWGAGELELPSKCLRSLESIGLTLDQQMSALAVIGSNLINPSMAPLSHASGAQSESNPDSGIQNGPNTATLKPITAGDKAGAAILTILVIAFTVGGTYWLLFD